MTALKEFERLESPGTWRAAPDEPRREVIVVFGDATLAITDAALRPLSHWSLAAVRRLNPGREPALYTADEDGRETLEIDDETMMNAIERVRRAIRRRRYRPGRGRLAAVGTMALVLGLLAALWLPSALVRHADAVLPAAARAAIGRQMLDTLRPLTGGNCHDADGLAALDALARRLIPDAPPALLVARSGVSGALALPGNIIVIGRDLVEDYDEPEVAAGHILVAATEARTHSPLVRLLQDAGAFATLRLLTTGTLPEGTLARHARHLVLSPPAPVLGTDEVIAVLGRAGISSTPYAYALDVTGESSLPLIEADPMRGQSKPEVLSDTRWVALQEICED
ncbi:MAG: hypothetical protein D6688_09960 [Alphaproteobacteria bacterium]|nr:MAG: hypothetical protein D6688_09960 [Alphaproteobacteria bacterium]